MLYKALSCSLIVCAAAFGSPATSAAVRAATRASTPIASATDTESPIRKRDLVGAALKGVVTRVQGQPASKAAVLKEEGSKVIEQRAEMAAALKAKNLFNAGSKVVVQRTEMAAALKAKTLFNAGSKVVVQRTEMAAALKAKTLFNAGAKVVAARAEMASAKSGANAAEATAATNVDSWYDQGLRLQTGTVVPTGNAAADDAVVDDDVAVNDVAIVTALPAGMSEAAATASPKLAEKALALEVELAELNARMEAFPRKEGTMFGIVRDKITATESRLAATIGMAQEAMPPVGGQIREAYYCNDFGCWVAQQYFCDETGCWITDDAADPLPEDAQIMGAEKFVPAPKQTAPKKAEKKAEPEQKNIFAEGIFAPAVKLTAEAMGRKELNAFRAGIIAKHTKVISALVDTSDSQFGQITLKAMFEAADKDGNGTLDKEEVKEALNALGFTFIESKDIDKIFKRADVDKNDVIDFEEFVKETPKTLKTSLVKLAKSNGHDLGFLA